jgi:outer membrane protein assembly factor BamD
LRRFALVLLCALTLAFASQCDAQIFHKKKKVDKSTAASNTAEPDKQLYDKAMDDIKRGRHEVGRLGLQTLINTYPDSEYLAKAKLAIADSYFKEGGSSNITLAINGYKDFIVFFPFLPEAAYAQMQVAMANYDEMAKPDRDSSHAKAAEEEFQTFLLKYPKDPLAALAEQRLREVQEVLAEGQFRIAYYYYLKGDRRAAAGRLNPLVQRYPLYSKADQALWMLGDIFDKSEKKDFAGFYYARIVKNYPLSVHAADAKGRLKAMGVPVPQPDPNSMAWMTAQQNAKRPKENLPHRTIEMLHSTPDVHSAAVSGLPTLEPESDSSGGDLLAVHKGTTLVANSSAGVVATVTPGQTAPAGASAEDVNSSSDSGTASTPDSAATDPTAQAQAGSLTGSSADNTQSSSANADQTTNPNQKESSSKKKGIRKIMPW